MRISILLGFAGFACTLAATCSSDRVTSPPITADALSLSIGTPPRLGAMTPP